MTKTFHIFQDYTGNFQAAVQIRNGKTNDRYINAGAISGKIKCRWTGYTVEAANAEEANDKYYAGEY
jgi:hypothetical protein